jgi:tyrosyl-tRNA synthetase
VTDSTVLARQSNDPSFTTLWDELQWRGLVHVSTDADELTALFEGAPITYYCGFDPTAPSLHLGNLVQLLLLRRIQLKGHNPLGLVGGSTGLVGDPKPTAERTLNDRETVAEWVGYLGAQISKFLDFSGKNPARLVNNLDWTQPMSAIDFLREIGKHFRVGTMLKKDAVSARLNSEAGISYTEFSYQVLQALDFLELYRQYGCVLQTGGSDQWGNLTSGTDLIHKVEGVSAHAIGTPLITNSDGTKFGKSEGNAVWLDPNLTSPYAMYQFWLNTLDADVVDRLKVFTFLSRAEIEALAVKVDAEPAKREAQRTLAWHVTALVHGDDVADDVRQASELAFGGVSWNDLNERQVRVFADNVPKLEVPGTTNVAAAFAQLGLTKSRSEAIRLIGSGALSYNDGIRIDDPDKPIGHLEHIFGWILLRKGKKSFGVIKIQI